MNVLLRRGFSRRLVAPAAVLVACCGVLAGGAAAAATAVPPVATAWGMAQRIPGVNTLVDVPPDANASAVTSVSCAAPGDCAAGGYAHGGGNSEGFNELAWVASETGGVWHAPVPVSMPSGDAGVSYDAITSVSCASPGNCVAGGYDTEAVEGTGYVDTYGALLISEVDGVWGTPEQVPGTDTLNQGAYARTTSVSCPAAGDCAVTGYVNNSSEFVDDESDGIWGTAQLVAGYSSAAGGSPVISCAAPGDCVVAGNDTAGLVAQTSVATESSGIWGSAAPLPGFAADGTVTSLSCPAPGDCAAGGSALAGKDQVPFVASETGGTWTSQEVPGYAGLTTFASSGGPEVSAVSCAAPGACTAGGSYQASAANAGVFVASETGGVWRVAQKIPGAVTVPPASHFSLGVAGISCPAAGDCATVVNNATTSVPYVTDEAGGTWTAVRPVAGLAGAAAASAVSCAAPGTCLAAGKDGEGSNADGYNEISGDWIVALSSSAVTRTAVGLSAARVTYGHEEAEKVSATVSATTPAPAGTVTITAGSTALCAIKLSAAGKGSCAIPVAGLAPGQVTLTARYGGGSGFAASAATSRPLTVEKAGTTTILKLSAARVPYGQEQREKLAVRVPPQYAGRPSRTVTVLWRGVTLCVITLNRDTGACVLGAKQLKPGTYNVVARYDADRNFNGSSAKEILTITG